MSNQKNVLANVRVEQELTGDVGYYEEWGRNVYLSLLAVDVDAEEALLEAIEDNRRDYCKQEDPLNNIRYAGDTALLVR